MFSLAALVHELLWGRRVSGTGSQAVEGITPLAGGELIRSGACCKRALAEDPGERHPTPKIFVDALKRAFPDVVVDLGAPVAPPPRSAESAPGDAEPGTQAPFRNHCRPLATPELDGAIQRAQAGYARSFDGESTERRREQPRFTDVEIGSGQPRP